MQIRRSIYLNFLILFCPILVFSSGIPWSQSANCIKEKSADEKLYSSDFSWNISLEKLISDFKKIYESNKRLPRRAYWNQSKNSLVMPYPEGPGANPEAEVRISPRFVQQIAMHIESAYENDYIDGVFFPDMGHSHLLIPTEKYNSKYDKYPMDKRVQLLEDFYEDSEIRVLYHTAEQLKTRNDDDQLVQDPRTQFRYNTRNIVGSNNNHRPLQVLTNPDSKANTVNDVPGYRWWGAGFSLSANKNGCLTYQGKFGPQNFDLSLYDLESQGGSASESSY